MTWKPNQSTPGLKILETDEGYRIVAKTWRFGYVFFQGRGIVVGTRTRKEAIEYAEKHYQQHAKLLEMEVR